MGCWDVLKVRNGVCGCGVGYGWMWGSRQGHSMYRNNHTHKNPASVWNIRQ